MRKISFLFVYIITSIMFIAAFYSALSAATINSDSTSYADVKAAYDAASPGDVVNVPAGSSTWATTLVITKSIYLQGAGIDSTTITGYGISFVVAGNKSFELSGFTFDSNAGALWIQNTSSTTPLSSVKIHHNKFSNSTAIAVQPIGLVFGVIYNNQFVDNKYDLKPLGANMTAWVNWPGIDNAGTENYFYIEDNTSSGPKTIVMSSGEGARWVYRYNTVTNNLSQLFDAHGDTLNRGVVAHELYENTFNGGYQFKGHDLKGGTGIVFNNHINATGGTYQGWIAIVEQYESCTNPGGCANDNGGCGDEINNSYIWGNVNDYAGHRTTVEESDTYSCIAPKVNYWTDTDSSRNDTGYFTKAVASGRNANVCTVEDVYWETDNRRLYRCTSTNMWTLIYTPYTYPHPLRIEQFQPNSGKRTGGGASGGVVK